MDLPEQLTCPTDQIRAHVLAIIADKRTSEEGWDPNTRIFIILILVWIIDNLNIPHKTELDTKMRMENLISIMVIVKEYAMSYNEMITIVGADGTLRNT